MKILFVASVYRHLTSFHIPFMKYFQDSGYEVWAAGFGEDREYLELLNVKCIDIPFSRNPLHPNNLEAFKQLKQLFKEKQFDLVHVHTPVAAFITRIAYKDASFGKLIYTAHGFHFFQGAPKKNWLLYYPLEKIAAKWTDHLITINEEDFANAKKILPVEKVSLVHGVGVEGTNLAFNNDEKVAIKYDLGLKENAVVISYIAELNDNKNHKFIFENWREIKASNPMYELLIIGTGEKENDLKSLVQKADLEDVHFLGYRRDVYKILSITDIVALLSLREGLPKSIMEAMASGIPCVVSNTRGLRDLIKSNENGFVINLSDNNQLVEAFARLSVEPVRKEMGVRNKKIIKPYLKEEVLSEYIEIYNKYVSLNNLK